jgi:hypothetical protein
LLARASILAPFLLIGWGKFPEIPGQIRSKKRPPGGEKQKNYQKFDNFLKIGEIFLDVAL